MPEYKRKIEIEVHPAVAKFALEMQRKLDANSHKGKIDNVEEDCDLDFLKDKLYEELKELEEQIELHEKEFNINEERKIERNILSEAADVANLCVLLVLAYTDELKNNCRYCGKYLPSEFTCCIECDRDKEP